VGLKLDWPLLGFVGFHKRKQLLTTEGGSFLSLGIHKWMPLELMRVIFITLLKGNWFLGCLVLKKLFFLDSCPVSGSLVGVSHWLLIYGYGGLLGQEDTCVLTYLWYISYPVYFEFIS
jgi:hypothetical protein